MSGPGVRSASQTEVFQLPALLFEAPEGFTRTVLFSHRPLVKMYSEDRVCVVSTGAYEFSRIMKLRENKDAYIDFVLGLFQSSREEKDLSGKYRLANIFDEKDGDPVEVYECRA